MVYLSKFIEYLLSNKLRYIFSSLNAAFLDMDTAGNGNLYNPFYNPPYKPQPGLLQPTNQLYPNQVQPINGQYYVPGLTNQNQGGVNIAPGAGNVNSKWPQPGLGSPAYQNGYQYPQQSYIVPNSGSYVPVPQNPAAQMPVQNVNANINPIAPAAQPGLNPNIGQQQVVGAGNSNIAPATQAPIQPVKQTTVAPASVNKVISYVNSPHSDTDASNDMDQLTDQIYNEYDNKGPSNGKDYNSYQKPDIVNNIQHRNDNKAPTIQRPVVDSGTGRHSEESDVDVEDYGRERTYPPATKTRTQVNSPTQSTVAGQKPIHSASHSEGFPDYSWMNMNYNDHEQRVSGKKGSVLKPSEKQKQSQVKQSSPNTVKTSQNPEQDSSMQGPRTDDTGKNKGPAFPPHTADGGRLKSDNEDDDVDDYRYDDYRRPSGSRRPYGRYEGRYDSPRRPAAGSRYPPYYDTGYPRGKGRNPYPVWDPYKDEYYYPDSYDDKPFGDYGKAKQGKQTVVKMDFVVVSLVHRSVISS